MTTSERAWRLYALPVVFLLALTLVVAIVRHSLHDAGAAKSAGTVTPRPAQVHRRQAAPAHRSAGVYVVRAGDTFTAIAARTGVPAARLLKLNPNASPTALFIGEKIHLR